MRKSYVIASGLGTIFTYISSLVCARILGRDSFGVVSIIYSTVLVSSSISSSSFIARTSYLIARDANNSTLIKNARVQGAVATILLAFVCSIVLFIFFANSINSINFLFVLPIILTAASSHALDRYMRYIFTSSNKDGYYAILCLVPSFLFVIISSALSLYWLLDGYIIALAIFTLIMWAANFYLATKAFGSKPAKSILFGQLKTFWCNLANPSYSILRQEMTITFPYFLSSLVGLLPFWGANIIILNSKLGFAGVGVSTIFYQFFLIAAFVPSLFSFKHLQNDANLFSSALRDISLQGLNPSRFTELLIQRSTYYLRSSLFSALLIPLFSFALSYYYKIAPLSQSFLMSTFLVLSIALSSSLYPFANAVIAAGNGWLGLLVNTIWAFTFLLSIAFNSARGYLFAMPISLLISYSIHALFLWAFVLFFPGFMLSRRTKNFGPCA